MSHGYITISDDQLAAERALARATSNSSAAFRTHQHAVHSMTQRSGQGKQMVSHSVVGRDNGKTTTYIAVFKYADGSESTFDGKDWVHKAAPVKVEPARELAEAS